MSSLLNLLVLPGALALGSAVVIAAGGVLEESAEESSLPSTPPMVEVMTVTTAEQWPRKRLLVGRVESRQSSDLGFEIAGAVVEIFVDEGDTVTAGQILARVDSARLTAAAAEVQARLAQAKAHLSELEAGTRESVLQQAQARVQLAKARLGLAQADHERNTNLRQSAAISARDFDQSTFALEAAEAEVALATWQFTELERGPRAEVITAQKATVTSLERQAEQMAVDIGKTTLTAPYDGIVSRRMVDLGRVVGTGDPVVHLLQSGPRRVRLGVPPSLVEALQDQGDQLTITSGTGQSWSGKLDGLLPDRDAVTRTRIALVESDDLDLAPGNLVEVPLKTVVSETGVALPVSALREAQRGLWSCLVAVPGDGDAATLESRSVIVLHTDGETVIVRGALADGELVVRSGMNRITPGMKVTVKQAATP